MTSLILTQQFLCHHSGCSLLQSLVLIYFSHWYRLPRMHLRAGALQYEIVKAVIIAGFLYRVSFVKCLKLQFQTSSGLEIGTEKGITLILLLLYYIYPDRHPVLGNSRNCCSVLASLSFNSLIVMYSFCEFAELFMVITLPSTNPSIPLSLCFTDLFKYT